MEYLIETKHTEKECLKALDEIVDYRSEFLEKVRLGCQSGVHIGWADVEAGSESEALEFIPVNLRSEARAIKVGKFTPEQIKGMHE